MESPKTLKFSKLDGRAMLPVRGSPFAAGLDLHALEETQLKPGERKAVRTGIAVQIPEGFYGRIAPRSSLAVTTGLDVLAGVIDCDYRGELICILINFGQEPLLLRAGMRIAQLIIAAIAMPGAEWYIRLNDADEH
jgi:dUTP pyrophosphatase